MKIRRYVSVALGALLLAFATALPVRAETLKDQLVGVWTLVLSDNVNPDGSRIHLYGSDPKGILTFDATGHYTLQIMSKDRPKFASNDKSKGTPEEYRASVVGTQCHFGTYTVDEQDSSITIHVEHATYTNWEGSDLKWPITIKADEVKFTVPHPTIGGPGVYGEIAYKRTR
ncbi:lipocalin-like domain-containing protein [Bradyrhizobium sp. dw_411]|uniref:lipocalin-like domain-containing protein n=1 Tax=Bradyrhizobium sp. dw_411 TaxID=2720082 RepID=UPI001BCCC269|nr:lipocalin-like domain-containing protein [Bradyrhizobium sp. dw_411]